jgi:MFS family permease
MAMVIVIGWQVYDIARETMSIREAAFQLGLIGLVQFVPLFLLTPVSGWTADRLDRRYIARAVVSLELLCALILFVATWRGFVSLPILFGVAALLGVARAFAGPALGALAPNLVPRAILPNAIALSSAAWQTGAIVGPALGGILYDMTPHLSYGFSTALFAFSVACLFTIPPIARTPLRPGSPIRQMVDGLAYVRRNRLVLGAITLDLFAVLLGGVTAMLPIYARDILRVGAEGLGPLRAAPAFGATVMAIIFSVQPLKSNVGTKMLIAVVVFGAATAIFGFSTSFPLSLAMLALLGAADMFSVYIRQSLIQLHTPDEMRGRVSAVSTLAISASNELGETRSGFAAALIGPVTATVAGGIASIGVTLLWAGLFPELRRARTFAQPESPPEEADVVATGV